MGLKKKIILSLIIFGTATIALICFVIYPLLTDIERNSQALVSQKEELILLQNKIKNLEKFKALYQELTPNLEKIDQLFIDPKVPIEFISFLKETARDCQLLMEISLLAPPGEIQTDPWPFFTFQIISSSSFPNFLKFLEKLETGPYLIKIQNLTVRRLTETELTQLLTQKELGVEFSLDDVNAIFLIKVFAKPR